MSTPLRSVIDAGLMAMEPGRFQDFCLEFLPLYDARFKSLARFGHTADGKTRPGTPDLLKTDSTGNQIAVECGTEEDYWKEKTELDNWKPLKDARKCLAALDKLSEIVLISTRETPTNAPNTKTRVSTILQEQTSAEITLLTREDVSQFLSNTAHELVIQQLLQKFFPEAYSFFQHEAESQTLRAARNVASQVRVRADTLFSLLDQSINSGVTIQNASQFVVDQVNLLYSYRLQNIPSFQGILREQVSNLSLSHPLSKVWSVTGIPKIGKTSLVLQLAHSWTTLDTRWYDCPFSDYACAHAIAEDILGLFITEHDTIDILLRSDLALSDAIKQAGDVSNATVFIIDNVDNLPDDGIRLLLRVISSIKRHISPKNLAIIFLSNKRLPELLSVVDHEISAPAWEATELGLLLQLNGITCEPSNPTGFLFVLSTLSGGHPVLALSLARRYPTTKELLAHRFSASPEVGDEMLSREVQTFLYKELLVDADSQNFVQRLSTLVHSANEEIFEIIRLNVNPQIRQTSAVLLNKLGGVVVEGSAQAGYKIPEVFREIASRHISKEERKSVYYAIYQKLLRPSGSTIYADRTTNGIFYALLADELSVAYFWVTFLVGTAYKNSLPKPQLKAILLGLHWIRFLARPTALSDLVAHTLMLGVLSLAYSRIKDYSSAIEILNDTWIDFDQAGPLSPEQEKALQKASRFSYCGKSYRKGVSR